MSYFIIIRGPLGIGKTTIAKSLAKRLNAEYISIDKVLEENSLNRKDSNYLVSDFIKANEIVLDKVKKALNLKKIVIFDGCFYFKEQIEHLEKNLPFKDYTFTLKAPVEACIKRDSKRKMIYGEEAARAVYNLVFKFDYGINIETENKTESQVIRKILTYLNK